MASGKGLLLGALGGLVLTEATVERVTLLAPALRRLELVGVGLRGAGARPGDKLQLLLPTSDVRTVTPVGWDAQAGRCALIVHVGPRAGITGATPLQAWALAASAGSVVRFIGPQRSLALPTAPRALGVVGDETSIGVAAAAAAAGLPVTAVLEVAATDALAAALTGLGVRATLVARTPGDAHYLQLATAVAALATAGMDVVLTGRAQTIQALRRAGVVRRGDRAVPYWSTGKRGLD